jgi:hypothetical protein
MAAFACIISCVIAFSLAARSLRCCSSRCALRARRTQRTHTVSAALRAGHARGHGVAPPRSLGGGGRGRLRGVAVAVVCVGVVLAVRLLLRAQRVRRAPHRARQDGQRLLPGPAAQRRCVSRRRCDPSHSKRAPFVHKDCPRARRLRANEVQRRREALHFLRAAETGGHAVSACVPRVCVCCFFVPRSDAPWPPLALCARRTSGLASAACKRGVQGKLAYAQRTKRCAHLHQTKLIRGIRARVGRPAAQPRRRSRLVSGRPARARTARA